jgi:hypothetical protein
LDLVSIAAICEKNTTIKFKHTSKVNYMVAPSLVAAENANTGFCSRVYQSFLEIKCTGFLEKHIKVVHLKILSFTI